MRYITKLYVSLFNSYYYKLLDKLSFVVHSILRQIQLFVINNNEDIDSCIFLAKRYKTSAKYDFKKVLQPNLLRFYLYAQIFLFFIGCVLILVLSHLPWNLLNQIYSRRCNSRYVCRLIQSVINDNVGWYKNEDT